MISRRNVCEVALVLTLGSLATALLLATQFVAPAAAQCTPDAGTPPTPPGPRVLVEYDMEGAAGLDDWRMASAWWPDNYAAGQRLLTEDVNVVVAGLFEGGAAVVDVYDQHGAGQPGFNVLPELLDRRVRRLFHRHDSDEVNKNVYDAVAIVAAHAKTGTGGFMAHTGSFGIVHVLNGRSVSEAELHAYSWGDGGAPVIFVSGDDRLRDDLRPVMPWLEYVITKRALSPKAVELRPLHEVRREMRDAAARGLRGLKEAKPLRLNRPIQAALRAVPPADLSALRDVPGIDYQDGEVRFEAATFQAAMRGLNALQRIATEMGGQPIVTELLKGMPNWAEIVRRREAGFWERWIELETERTQAAAPHQELIAFDSERGGKWDIYTVQPDGSTLRRLTFTGEQGFESWEPEWSPDRKTILFNSNRHGGEYELYLMKADGSNVRRLTHTPGGKRSSWSGDFSPDGKQIVFHSNRHSVKQGWSGYEVDLMNADGTEIKRLTDSPGYDGAPVWSPDGKQIAFMSDRDGKRELYLMDSDGSNIRRLTHDSRAAARPAWSHDGKQIAFMSTRHASAEQADDDKEFDIYVTDADGSNIRRLTDSAGSDVHPDWSPDGKQVVFMSQRDGKYGIYVMSTDGSDVRRLTSSEKFEGHPDW